MYIDPATIPVLVKSLDFLFDESKKILQERRERRQAQRQNRIGSDNKDAHIPPLTFDSDEALPRITIQEHVPITKDELLRQKISSAVWQSRETEVSHLLSMLTIYKRSYYLAKEKYAKWGGALVPPIIIHELDEAENGISTTTKELQTILSSIYGKEINILKIDNNIQE
jgi:hypothetical protein